MALITKAPRGTQDVLPAEVHKWRYIEKTALETAELYGFTEIRIPVFEHTELFNRSVGDTTDVVQKEMYTFNDKGGRSLTLRPEGTAGVARAVLEHNLNKETLPLRVSYVVSCYRYEKPQAGRLREFHQFGLELFGAESPMADAEVIMVANAILQTLGIKDVALEINSIGCPKCREEYHKALREYFTAHLDEMCETCQGRLETNPMRILDCKSTICSQIAEGAPRILDYLCEDCQAHFETVKDLLENNGIDFTVNPTIVRGLDYYTRTVFEFVATGIGAQGTVCGGGRYDGLIEEIGGSPTCGLGFGMGLERLLLVMEQEGCEFPEPVRPKVYIASIGEEAAKTAAFLTESLRREGFPAQCDLMNRSVKAQMKYADKIGAQYTVVIGDDEVDSGSAKIKNMETGEQCEVNIIEIAEYLYDVDYESTLESLQNAAGSIGDIDLSKLL
ncbi:MAG: histidine--tRNA ligase [Oscillospiraceae bacterium]|jgi:histidyl-tRNA synthetase|nr:histidine--tRNA ligase [Oscillospiraceae bacterium]